MAFKVSYVPSFRRDIKSFRNTKAHSEIEAKIKELLDSPKSGEFLKGKLSNIRKASFGHHPEIRILYTLYECCLTDKKDCTACLKIDEDDGILPSDCEGLIQFVAVDTREKFNNLYKQWEKLTKHSFDDLILLK